MKEAWRELEVGMREGNRVGETENDTTRSIGDRCIMSVCLSVCLLRLFIHYLSHSVFSSIFCFCDCINELNLDMQIIRLNGHHILSV